MDRIDRLNGMPKTIRNIQFILSENLRPLTGLHAHATRFESLR
jgi:hypothetical protein